MGRWRGFDLSVLLCVFVGGVCVRVDNAFSAEGAETLAGVLGQLSHLRDLYLGSKFELFRAVTRPRVLAEHEACA